MANSFVSSLETLDPTSVNNVSSLFFFLSNNGTNNLISGKILEQYLCYRQSTLVVRTTDYSITANVPTEVQWEHVARDPLGLFNAASNTLITTNFTGYIQFKFCGASKTGGGTYVRRRMTKNGTQTYNSGHQGWRDFNTGYSWPTMTGPIECVSGDYFEMQQQYSATNTQNGTNGATWLEAIPLQVYK